MELLIHFIICMRNTELRMIKCSWIAQLSSHLSLLICLIVSFRFIDRLQSFFTHMETLLLPVKGCKFWPMLGTVSEGSLACYTYCDTGHPFLSEDPWHSQLLPSVWQWNCRYLFLRLMSVAAGIPTPKLPLTGPTLLPNAPPPRFEPSKKVVTYKIWLKFNKYSPLCHTHCNMLKMSQKK